MSKIRILVIEDNPIHAAKAEMLLDGLGYSFIGLAKNSDEALKLFRSTKPDLVLLDIGLASSDDGIQVAEKLNNIRTTPIIFTTSFTDKTTFNRAKSTNPYAYLLKPIGKDALQMSIELAILRFSQEFLFEPLSEQFAGWTQDILSKDAFFVKTSAVLEKVYYDDVLWICITTDRYCEIVTASRAFRIRASLKQLEGKLSYAQFVRIHRSYIINMKHVESINEQEMLVKVGEESIPLGVSYKQSFLQRLSVL